MTGCGKRARDHFSQVDFGAAAGAGRLARGWREPGCEPGRAASANLDTIV
jgi:hypothetical protein